MELNYKKLGEGEPIIILHGLFGMLDNWQTLARKLAKNYTVYLIDQRNHGRSPHTDTHTYIDMATDLKAFLDQELLTEVHIMGHSMGGKTAMQFATYFPEMVDHLIVVDIAPKVYPRGHDEIFKALHSLRFEEASSRKDVDDQLAEYIDNLGIRQFLLKNIVRDKVSGFRLRMNLPVIFQDYEKILAIPEWKHHFEGPALFIRGEKSPYVDEADMEEITAVFPAAKLETVKEAGHWVHAEKPEELLQLLRTFLIV
jgi:pimeloyl-ACP methyl ester carboxylesterase